MDRKRGCRPGREVIGFMLLAALLLAGALSARFLGDHHRDLAQTVDSALWDALEQDWDGAASLSAQARALWQEKRKLCAVFSDHRPMEEIDSLFARLSVQAALRDRQAFADLCVALSQSLRAMADAHRLSLSNLL